MKKLICLLFCCLLFLPAAAQWKWHNPMEAGFPVIQNQGFTKEIGNSYTRLPERAKGVVSEPVWNLSRHSAGLAIHFYSNAPQIKVRYTVTGSLNMPHMPSTGVSGVDLYSINSDGEWHFCFGNYSFKDTITYTYNNIGKDRYHKQGFEYRLYLPLYNGVKWLRSVYPKMRNWNSSRFLSKSRLSCTELRSHKGPAPPARQWHGERSSNVRWITRS